MCFPGPNSFSRAAAAAAGSRTALSGLQFTPVAAAALRRRAAASQPSQSP